MREKKLKTGINKREKAILKFIEKQINKNGYPPSVREIGEAVDLKSTATVHGYLSRLEQKGYIKKEEQKGRTLRLLKGEDGKERNKKAEPKNLYTGISKLFAYTLLYGVFFGFFNVWEPYLAVSNPFYLNFVSK